MYKSLSRDELLRFQKLWVETRPEFKAASKEVADAQDALDHLHQDPPAVVREFLDRVIEGRRRVQLAKETLENEKVRLQAEFERQVLKQ